jgi:hypothetical protein
LSQTATLTVTALIPTVLAKKLKTFCNRVSLTQPQVIRTLVFNVLTTYHPAMEESKTSWMRSAHIQQRNFDRYEGSTVFINAALAVRQSNRLDGMSRGIGIGSGSIVRILIRNLLMSTKPGKAELAFLVLARHLMSRLPSSPQWGYGCERSPDQKRNQAFDFMDEHPKLSYGRTAVALRGLGIRHSREWIAQWQ